MVASEDKTTPGNVWPILRVLASPSLHILEPLSLYNKQNPVSATRCS
jgi:hypothetical protein